jgi:uncharacterized OB-fold protein
MDTLSDAPPRPVPHVDEESADYWEGLRARVLRLQRCEACGRARFPAMPGCPYCGAPASRTTQVVASGRGLVYSFVRVHRALTPAMAGEVPYVVAVVSLAEGPRVIARIESGAGGVRIDDAVRPRFVEHDGWTELRFDVAAPVGGA